MEFFNVLENCKLRPFLFFAFALCWCHFNGRNVILVWMLTCASIFISIGERYFASKVLSVEFSNVLKNFKTQLCPLLSSYLLLFYGIFHRRYTLFSSVHFNRLAIFISIGGYLVPKVYSGVFQCFEKLKKKKSWAFFLFAVYSWKFWWAEYFV